jgi:tetratricopeptide (TPR) repeat protein
MLCSDFNAGIPAYLEERLQDGELEAFEMHYFECDLCFAQLKLEERLFSKEISIPLKHAGAGKRTGGIFGWNWRPLTALSTIASILLAVVLSAVYFIGSFNKAERLEEYYRISQFSAPVYITSETRREGSSSAPTTMSAFNEAMNHYNTGDYSRALEIFGAIPAAGKNPQIGFFKGVCHLLEDQLEEAIKEFDDIVEAMNPSYYDEAIYYKSIALLRLDRSDDALLNLRNLSGMFSPYASKAKKLIQQITNR